MLLQTTLSQKQPTKLEIPVPQTKISVLTQAIINAEELALLIPARKEETSTDAMVQALALTMLVTTGQM